VSHYGHASEQASPTPAVRTALTTTGQPLDHDTRAEMEPLFGFDFGRVRIHSGARAEQATESLGANALTHGDHVVLGRGADAGTLAHELAHVVQQQGTASGDTERAADDAAEAALAGQAVRVAGHADPATVHMQPKKDAGQRLNTPEGAREYVSGRTWMFVDEAKRVDAGEKMLIPFSSAIKLNRDQFDTARELIHTQLRDDPALHKDLRAAYVEVTRAWVNAEAKRSKQTPAQVLAANEAVIWPEGEPNPKGSELIDAVPEAERQQLRVVRAPFTVPNLQGHFGTLSGGASATLATLTIPAKFGPGVPDAPHLRKGLSGVAAELMAAKADNLATEKQGDKIAVLPENATVTVVLDLKPFKGPHGAFRFTHIRHQKRAKPAVEMLIEYLGTAGAESLTRVETAAAGAKLTAAKIRLSGFKQAELPPVYQAIDPIAQATLAKAAGMVITRVREDKGEEAAKYIPDSHSVEVYNGAYKTGDVRMGAPGAGMVQQGTHTITHEIGHAVDLAALREAQAKVDRADAALNAASGTFANAAAAARFAAAKDAADKAAKDQLKARAYSGVRMVPKGPAKPGRRADLEDSLGPAGPDNIEFREAVLKDGKRRLTDYSEQNWGEAFAEAFAIYHNTPDEMKRLRPNLFAWFSKTFPRERP